MFSIFCVNIFPQTVFDVVPYVIINLSSKVYSTTAQQLTLQSLTQKYFSGYIIEIRRKPKTRGRYNLFRGRINYYTHYYTF